MRNRGSDKNQNRKEDAFYDYFMNNLEDHQMPVDERCWENIQQRIHPRKRNRLWIALYPGVAAAVLLFLIFVQHKDSNLQNSLVYDNPTRSIENNTQKQALPNEVTFDKEFNTPKENNANRDQRPTASRNVTTDSTSIHKPIATIAEIMDTTIYQNATEKNRMAKEVTGSKDSVLQKKKTEKLNLYNDNILLAYTPKNSKKRKWVLGASVGASGTTSSFVQDDLAKTALSSFGCVEQSIPSKHAISDAEYALPLSVGLLVRKRLNNTLSLETGFTYSYLSTTYKDIENRYYSAKLKLHYMGVPVNLVVDIWNITPRWKLYASSGIMIEKGIRSDYSQHMYETKKTIRQGQSITGLQWSANASVGLSYKFYQDWNFYLEPHVSYYFDNKQPISIRTEKQTIVTINSGFRYEF